MILKIFKVIAQSLAWFFLFIFSLFYSPLKKIILTILLFAYRGYRFIKKQILVLLQPNFGSAKTGLTSILLAGLTLALVIGNASAYSASTSDNQASLLERLIVPEIETTTLAADDLTGINTGMPTIPAQPTALENKAVSEASQLNQASELGTELLTENQGALTKQNLVTEFVGVEAISDYTVRPGETVSDIATKFNLKTNTLLWANNLSSNSIIRPDDKLKILPLDGVVHKVLTNETLSHLAEIYDISVVEIMQANKLVSANQVQSGKELIMPGAEPQKQQLESNTRLASLRRIFAPDDEQLSNTGFSWPTSSRHITQYYWLGHRAIDIGGNLSLSILASKGGRVAYSGWSNGYGYNIVLEHGQGVRTRYAHLSQLFVKIGEQITQGEELGKMGTTGRSTGVHLHFEIIDNDIFLNPLSYL